MSEIILRDYRAGDWQAMYALDLVCFAAPFQFSRRAMRGFAEVDGAITLLAEEDAQLAGFCIAHIETQTGYVVTLDVAPAWRRRGLGRQLMHELEARAQGSGADSMALHVFAGNDAAIRLYEALGYEQAETARDFYGRGVDALVYRKALVPPTSEVP